MHFLQRKLLFWGSNFTEVYSSGPPMVEIKAQCRIGDKPFVTNDAYTRHSVPLCKATLYDSQHLYWYKINCQLRKNGTWTAIIWNNAYILSIGTWGLGGNLGEILIKVRQSLYRRMNLKMSAKWRLFCQQCLYRRMNLKMSAKWRPFCQDLSVLMEATMCPSEYFCGHLH